MHVYLVYMVIFITEAHPNTVCGIFKLFCTFMQESYSLLQKHHIQVNQEDIDRVDTLRYMWQNVSDQVCKVQTLLLEIQPKFKCNLEENLGVFQMEVYNYMESYQTVSEDPLTKYIIILMLQYPTILIAQV